MTQTEREALITSHLYIAEAEAGKAYRKWPEIPEGDHYSAAALGLMKAAEAYDPARGNVFKTLAGWWVRGEIKHQIRLWSRKMYCVPKDVRIRVDSLESFRVAGSSDDGACLADVVPDALDLEDEAITALTDGQLAAAISGLPCDYADAVREVVIGRMAWVEFARARGWTHSQTEGFVKRFRSEIADRLRASRPVAEMVGGRTVTLLLNSGGAARVDEFDFDRLRAYRWHLDQRGFAYRWERRRKRRTATRLHHAVVGNVPKGYRVLPIDGDSLDCRRSNLVIVPRWQAYHRRAARNEKGLIGVSFHPFSQKWVSRLMVDGTAIQLGSFGTPQAAAAAYDKAAREHLGPFATLNYPHAH